MSDPRQIETTSRELDKISFPALERPAVPAGTAATPELIDWGCRFYCFSILSHTREMLRSFLVLVWNGLTPASFVIARCLFEIGAHTHYTHKHLFQYLDGKDLENAWKFLHEINMGSRYMLEEYGEKLEEWPPFAAPREIAKVIRAFDEWTKKQSRTEYSFLSEFAHPNMAAFSHYYNMELGKTGVSVATFIEPRRDSGYAPWSHVSISVVSTLYFAQLLLRRAGEKDVEAQIGRVLKKLE